ncbi:alpha/beta fold hydrolase [Epilithonimonas arachidiradicis]|uniref:Lipolytic protein n=1 Tax=Epilithonimonas arachidiradicis TaxID=1617282 RepID=A0A420CL23_9FLAO|nr:alpha/beta hydrolase [Epilithonimonas arachidiradicis]RKE79084.1 pimeloyl-ACP methyl ester carboxylesterase [Epilithonimonas arachidiradicis]GGG60085.1 lipolytic protein [Epilithonimonas arachidiradicis]
MKLSSNGFEKANDINLYYEIYGEGKPLVLIHGGGSSGFYDFEETIKRLKDDFQLIVIDLQNHGKSEHRYIPETFEQDARDIMAVLEKLNIVNASFFGFSNGATTVLQIAHLFPDKIEKVIAASGVTKRNGMIDGFFEGMAKASVENIMQKLKENFLKINPDENLLKNMFEKDSQRMINFQDIDDEILQSIKCPVFLIAGDKDVIKVQHIAEMNQLIPHSKVMILPAGHGNYMMADENGNSDTELIDFTMSQIKKFLNS